MRVPGWWRAVLVAVPAERRGPNPPCHAADIGEHQSVNPLVVSQAAGELHVAEHLFWCGCGSADYVVADLDRAGAHYAGSFAT